VASGGDCRLTDTWTGPMTGHRSAIEGVSMGALMGPGRCWRSTSAGSLSSRALGQIQGRMDRKGRV